jgi:hypothetical protein
MMAGVAAVADGPSPVGYVIAGVLVLGAIIESTRDNDSFTVDIPSVYNPYITAQVAQSDQTRERDSTATSDIARTDSSDRMHWHHIVAKAAWRADPARRMLERFGMTVNDPDNLIPLRGKFHSRLHTIAYYDYVNSVMSTAKSEASVRFKLNQLRIEITNYSYTGISAW